MKWKYGIVGICYDCAEKYFDEHGFKKPAKMSEIEEVGRMLTIKRKDDVHVLKCIRCGKKLYVNCIHEN